MRNGIYRWRVQNDWKQKASVTVLIRSRWQVGHPRRRGMSCNLPYNYSAGLLPGRLDYPQGDRAFSVPRVCLWAERSGLSPSVFLENKDVFFPHPRLPLGRWWKHLWEGTGTESDAGRNRVWWRRQNKGDERDLGCGCHCQVFGVHLKLNVRQSFSDVFQSEVETHTSQKISIIIMIVIYLLIFPITFPSWPGNDSCCHGKMGDSPHIGYHGNGEEAHTELVDSSAASVPAVQVPPPHVKCFQGQGQEAHLYVNGDARHRGQYVNIDNTRGDAEHTTFVWAPVSTQLNKDVSIEHPFSARCTAGGNRWGPSLVATFPPKLESQSWICS